MLFHLSRLLLPLLVVATPAAPPPVFGQEQNLALPLAANTSSLSLQSVMLEAEAMISRKRRATVSNGLPLNTIVSISSTLYDQVAFGDTDHDGRNEVIVYDVDADGTFHYKVFEEQGNNVYSMEYSGAPLIPYATGDLDLDGKAEIIGQEAGSVDVYESLDTTSHPTELVWSSGPLSTVVGCSAIGDTDRDGRLEIIHSQNSFGSNSNLLVFENTGDNTFELVYSDTVVGNGATGEKVIADLDGDGLTEIAFSGLHGGIFIYESPANNVWQLIWNDSTGMSAAYGAEGGRDTDGNGTPELFIMGNGPGGWTTIVYEPVSDNLFASVDTFAVEENVNGLVFNALGNLNAVGADEYVMDGQCCLWVYQATAPGNWEPIQEITDPTPAHHTGLHTYDVNQNGRDELFWTDCCADSTLVLEHPGVPTAVHDRPRTMITLSPFPNPARLQASLGIETVHEPTSVLAVFDAAGRLVERRVVIRDSLGQLLWPVQHLPSGIYFLRLENRNGATLAFGRGIVVR